MKKNIFTIVFLLLIWSSLNWVNAFEWYTKWYNAGYSDIVSPEFSFIKNTKLESLDVKYIDYSDWMSFSKTPKIIEHFIKKIWTKKLRYLIETKKIYVLWWNNWAIHFGQDTKKSSSFFSSKEYIKFNSNIFVSQNISFPWNNEDIIEKVKIFPVNKEIYSGRYTYHDVYACDPTIFLYHNSSLYQDLILKIWWKKYIAKQKFFVKEYEKSDYEGLGCKSWKSYGLIPYYEFKFKIPKWEKKLNISYSLVNTNLDKNNRTSLYYFNWVKRKKINFSQDNQKLNIDY